MSDAGPGTSGEDIWQPKGNPWIIAAAVSLAAFMEVLDTSIANVALAPYRGQSWRQQRREHVGVDKLSCLERNRSADKWMASRMAWAEAFLFDVHRFFHS